MANLRNRRLAALTKSAKSDIVKTSVLRGIILSTLVIFIAGFIAVSMYNNNGAFTISVENNNSSEYQKFLSLSETENFAKSTSVLNAQQFLDMSDMSGNDLPNYLDSLGGGIHNKNSEDQYYYAYTFFLQNSGGSTANYRYSVIIKEATKNLEKCIRIRLYINGEYKTYAYARTRDDEYNHIEPGTIPFMDAQNAIIDIRENFGTGDVDKYTIVIWIEGDDPDTGNEALGGTIRFQMRFEIVEN